MVDGLLEMVGRLGLCGFAVFLKCGVKAGVGTAVAKA